MDFGSVKAEDLKKLSRASKNISPKVGVEFL